MDWKQDDPLARCTGETRKSNIALWDYALMGPGRSLRKLLAQYVKQVSIKPPTRKWNTISTWCLRYHWVARVAAWEAIKTAEDEAEWDERRRDIRKGEWEQAQTLLDRAEQMLKFPLAQVERVEETYPDGKAKAVTIVNPVRWSQRDIARFMQVASELGRLAAEMEQRRQTLDLQSGGKPIAEFFENALKRAYDSTEPVSDNGSESELPA